MNKEIILIILIPVALFLAKYYFIKYEQYKEQILEVCDKRYAKKEEIATKNDIIIILDNKFSEFELRLIKEGRLKNEH
jgi:hypothetical protein